MPMRIDRLPTGRALAWEAQLFDEVSRHPEKSFLKVWEGDRSLVAPRKLAALTDFPDVAARLADEGWPVHVRATGGDVTPQGPGILNVTHVYTWQSSGPFDIAAGYHRLCAPIEAALGAGASRGWQPGAFCDGAYNVQWNGLKFAGTAMRFRPGHTVLAHALMLIEPPEPTTIAALNRFLSALNQDRIIQEDTHTGLPNGQTVDDFITRLVTAFDEEESGN